MSTTTQTARPQHALAPQLDSRSRRRLVTSRLAPHANQVTRAPKRVHVITGARGNDDEPDWNKEMKLFSKRISAPNQLATLRELEARVQVGRVLFLKDSLAIVSGLNADAPLGTKLTFVTGATGVLLWHRSDNIAFVLILGGAAAITQGMGVECKIKGVLQVIDESQGPVTKKEYELLEVPAGEALFGQVTNHVGVPQQQPSANGSSLPEPSKIMDRVRPLLNTQVQMKNREQISEPLTTGVKALDVLTPLGRGSCLLVVGAAGSGKSSLAEDSVLGQRTSGVQCVIASTTRTAEQLAALQQRLQAAGAMPHTCIVATSPDAPTGEQYAALCTAHSIGEAVRDKGGHCLVVVDDIQSLAHTWDTLATTGLGSLGKEVVWQGLIKDAAGHDLVLPSPTSEQELVDYEGMLVTGAVAQRRGFFSTLFMRSAKMARNLGGGSLTTLVLVPGKPATGIKQKIDMSKYQTLSPEQLAKIQVILDQKAAAAGVTGAGDTDPGELTTEAVEEFISIADGQLVLEPRASSSEPYRANPKLSITRIGSRAFPKALEVLGPPIRLGLAQAEDARKYKLDVEAVSQKADDTYLRMAAALTQPQGRPASLEEQVVTILAVQRGYASGVQPQHITSYLERAYSFVQLAAPQALAEVRTTRQLTATAEKAICEALHDLNQVPRE